jgi:hypothetical protein
MQLLIDLMSSNARVTYFAFIKWRYNFFHYTSNSIFQGKTKDIRLSSNVNANFITSHATQGALLKTFLKQIRTSILENVRMIKFFTL